MLSSFFPVSLAIPKLINLNEVSYSEYIDWYPSNPLCVSVYARSARVGLVHCITEQDTLQTHQVFVFTPDWLEQVI